MITFIHNYNVSSGKDVELYSSDNRLFEIPRYSDTWFPYKEQRK